MKISELMTKEALVIKASVPVDRMTKLFAKHEITGAPVIDESGDLIGVVSMSDMARKTEGERQDKHEYYLNPSWGAIPTHSHEEAQSKTVGDIMTNLIIYAEEDDDIEVAADLMVNHGIHRVVVTKNNKVVGVISSSDLVREFRDRIRAAKRLQG